jgi:RNA polymerase sigma-70 factor (ECF subfamily)
MSTADEVALVEAARADDEVAFAELVEPHRRELRVHCYRMVGSFEEAEDLTQDTFLRAWRHLGTFEGRSTFRAWLYRIATNVCLELLGKRSRRVLPADVAAASPPSAPVPAAVEGVSWLEPFPDRLLDLPAADARPDVLMVAKETIELAFLAAIQHLPPRQRAVLILRDVLGWSARETGDLLDLSVPAVKSALQRGRATLRQHLPERRTDWQAGRASEAEEALLRRYIAAHDDNDQAALADLLAEDVRVSFPPTSLWYDGRDDFIAGSREHAAVGEYKFVPTRANAQPAVAIYLKRPGSTTFRPLVLEVLTVAGGRIVAIVDYDLPGLFAAFGLPEEL